MRKLFSKYRVPDGQNLADIKNISDKDKIVLLTALAAQGELKAEKYRKDYTTLRRTLSGKIAGANWIFENFGRIIEEKKGLLKKISDLEREGTRKDKRIKELENRIVNLRVTSDKQLKRKLA